MDNTFFSDVREVLRTPRRTSLSGKPGTHRAGGRRLGVGSAMAAAVSMIRMSIMGAAAFTSPSPGHHGELGAPGVTPPAYTVGKEVPLFAVNVEYAAAGKMFGDPLESLYSWMDEYLPTDPDAERRVDEFVAALRRNETSTLI